MTEFLSADLFFNVTNCTSYTKCQKNKYKFVGETVSRHEELTPSVDTISHIG